MAQSGKRRPATCEVTQLRDERHHDEDEPEADADRADGHAGQLHDRGARGIRRVRNRARQARQQVAKPSIAPVVTDALDDRPALEEALFQPAGRIEDRPAPAVIVVPPAVVAEAAQPVPSAAARVPCLFRTPLGFQEAVQGWSRTAAPARGWHCHFSKFRLARIMRPDRRADVGNVLVLQIV